jgi:glycine oxidase
MREEGEALSGDTRHVVVAGAGAAGCATAYYLSAAGVPVTLIEREGPGTQASGWSAGGLNPLHGVPPPVAALAMESFRLHLSLWPELERLTGQALDARRIAMALVAPDEAAIPRLRALGGGFERAEGFSARWLDGATLRALEPRLAPGLAGALLTQGNGVLDSYRFTIALAAAAQRQGARLRLGPVTGIRHDQRRVTGVRCADGVIPCDAVVIALGPWSQDAAAWLGRPLPVEPLKGELLRLAALDPPLACDVVAPQVSLFSRAGGQVWLGATQERRGFDTAPSAGARRTLSEHALRLMPALAGASPLQQTACLRPVTPDGLPVLGRAPGWEGAYVATGGGAKGILLAPAMGRAIADLILAGRTSLSVSPCAPDRFSPQGAGPRG